MRKQKTNKMRELKTEQMRKQGSKKNEKTTN